MKRKINACIIGLGYVGLPLALEFSKKYYPEYLIKYRNLYETLII